VHEIQTHLEAICLSRRIVVLKKKLHCTVCTKQLFLTAQRWGPCGSGRAYPVGNLHYDLFVATDNDALRVDISKKASYLWT